MSLQKDVLNEVVEVIGEVALHHGSVSPKFVRDKFLGNSELSALASEVMIVGNVASSGINYQESGFRWAKKLLGKEVVKPEIETVQALMGSLPGILEALASRPKHVGYGTDALGMLEDKNLLPNKYKFSVNLIGKLIRLADMLPKEQ